MIRILLADDHPIVREGLRAVLETQTDFAVVAEKYAELISEHGGSIFTSTAVTGLKRRTDEIVVETTRGDFATVSGGLRIARRGERHGVRK